MPCLYVQLLASYGTVAALANNWMDVVKVAVITALPLAARSNYYTLVVLALFSPCYFIMPRTKFATIKLPSSLVLAGKVKHFARFCLCCSCCLLTKFLR